MNGIKSTGKGKSGKSYGAKRVKRISKEVILGITKPAIREEELKELGHLFMKKLELF